MYLRAATEIDEVEKAAIVASIAADPLQGDVMQGTGGCRKVRFSRPGRGKSAGYRVIYLYCGEELPVFLLTVFGKNEKGNLSQAERNALRRMVAGFVDDYGRKL